MFYSGPASLYEAFCGLPNSLQMNPRTSPVAFDSQAPPQLSSLHGAEPFLRIVAQLVKKFTAFLWNPEAHYRVHSSGSFNLAKWIHYTLTHPVPSKSILILSFYLCLGIPDGHCSLGFLPSSICRYYYCLAHFMPHPSHLPSFIHPNNIWWRQIMKFFIIFSSMTLIN